MTHDQLVARAKRWLAGTMRCCVVLTEKGTSEIPDAIGWKYDGRSILVECKATRADFLQDRHKPSRRVPELGMGMLRYYMTPPGLTSVDEVAQVAPGWGLCVVKPKQVRVLMHAASFYHSGAPGAWRERRLLIVQLACAQAKTEGASE